MTLPCHTRSGANVADQHKMWFWCKKLPPPTVLFWHKCYFETPPIRSWVLSTHHKAPSPWISNAWFSVLLSGPSVIVLSEQFPFIWSASVAVHIYSFRADGQFFTQKHTAHERFFAFLCRVQQRAPFSTPRELRTPTTIWHQHCCLPPMHLAFFSVRCLGRHNNALVVVVPPLSSFVLFLSLVISCACQPVMRDVNVMNE